MNIRPAQISDAEQIGEICRFFVSTTAITFDEVPPTLEEMKLRISEGMKTHPWFVAEDKNNHILGYAYASTYRKKSAYRFSAEVTIYTHPSQFRQGVGRGLYSTLLNELIRQGYSNAFAGIALPNEGSVKFHQFFDFERIGVFKQVGYKFEKWHDVEWWGKRLCPAT